MRFEANCFRWRDIRVKLVNKGFDYNSNKQKSVKSIGHSRNCSYFNRGQYPVEYNEVFLDFSSIFKLFCLLFLPQILLIILILFFLKIKPLANSYLKATALKN